MKQKSKAKEKKNRRATTTGDAFFTAEEAAAFLKVQPDTIYAWTHRRRIPFRKHGSRLVFSKRDLMKWSQAQAVYPTDEAHFGFGERRGGWDEEE